MIVWLFGYVSFCDFFMCNNGLDYSVASCPVLSDS